MKINEHTVPYSAHHVPSYHTWMQNPDLQKLTASEPLTLDEEYDMQRSWREDGDKLTFIVCLPKIKGNLVKKEETEEVVGRVDDVSERMIGDVNLFLTEDNEDDDDHEEGDGDGSSGVIGEEEKSQKIVGEIEIMVARTDARGKGLGHAILLTFLWYIFTNLELILGEYTHCPPNQNKDQAARAVLKFLRVKIDVENERSIKLFEKVGFTKTSPRPNYFGEVELRLSTSKASSLDITELQEPSIASYRVSAAVKDEPSSPPS